jgi:hypothetical protein
MSVGHSAVLVVVVVVATLTMIVMMIGMMMMVLMFECGSVRSMGTHVDVAFCSLQWR